MRRILAAALALGFSCFATAHAVSLAEREALITLYENNGGADWGFKDHWLEAPGSECTWYGVECSAGGAAVTRLILSGNGLRGTIPPQLADLQGLRYLDLSSNRLVGTIPPELGSLDRLEFLMLTANRLEGPIPAEIGNLSHLTHLALIANQLTGTIPPGLGEIRGLTDLYLGENRLSGTIPESLAQTRLTVLDLHGNELTGPIPPAFASLSRLYALNLGNNRLTGSIPAGFGNLSNLYELTLTNNQLTGAIPEDLRRLSNLHYLSLGRNPFSLGPVPSWLPELPELFALDLKETQRTGPIPAFFSSIPNLVFLDLGGNLLQGQIPAELGRAQSLIHLRLDHNRLSGPIPPQLGSIPQLDSLDLKSNRLIGPVPPELTNFPPGRHTGNFALDLRWNGLSQGDAAVVRRLNAQHATGDFRDTQTVPPRGLQAVATSPTSFRVSWNPIRYRRDPGYYGVLIATSEVGPFQLAAVTFSKQDSFVDIAGGSLTPGQTYYFKIHTVTLPHANNENRVIGRPGPAIRATLPAH